LAEKTDSPPAAATEPPLTFEQSLEQLEQIVRQLEEGQLGLTESLERYEQGVKHLRQCSQALEVAERKIELLVGVDAAGNPVTESFAEGEMTLEEKAAARTQRRSRPARRSGPRTETTDDAPPDQLF
jgi:exodeoxyribonuclease VII small subunit